MTHEDLKERIMEEAHGRISVTVELLDTLIAARRAEIAQAFNELVQSGALRLHPGPEGGYSVKAARPDPKALLTVLCHRPRTFVALLASVSWSAAVLQTAIDDLVATGHLSRGDGILTPTEKGRAFAGWVRPAAAPPQPRAEADRARERRRDETARAVFVALATQSPLAVREAGRLADLAYNLADALEKARG